MADEAEIVPNITILAIPPLPGAAGPTRAQPARRWWPKMVTCKHSDRFYKHCNSAALATHFSSDDEGELDEPAE